MQISRVQFERIMAADLSRLETELRLEEVKGERSEAKKLLEQRREGLFEAMKAAREEHGDGKIPPGDMKSLFKIEEDYQRAHDRFELKDRENKKTDALYKQLCARVFELLKGVREEEDLYTKKDPGTKGDDPTAWKQVGLHDIVGETFAHPFAADGIVDVGTFIEKSDAEELKIQGHATLIKYVHHKVASYVQAVKAEPVPRKFIREAPEKLPSLDKIDVEEPKPVDSGTDKPADEQPAPGELKLAGSDYEPLPNHDFHHPSAEVIRTGKPSGPGGGNGKKPKRAKTPA